MYSSDPILNPEPTYFLKNHFVNFRSSIEPNKIIYGVEDILRTKSFCDNDFNDLIFYITTTNVSNSILPSCYNSINQQVFDGTIICEDLLNKQKRDLDYNDLVMEYNVTENISDNKITSIIIKISLLGRGSELNHDFGVIIPKIKNMNDVKIFREEYIGISNTRTFYNDTHSIYNKGTDCIPIIKNTNNFLKHNSFWAANTDKKISQVIPSYSTLRIVFPNGGISRSEINNRFFPYNFYLRVYRENKYLWELYSDVSYNDVSEALKNININSKKKIFIIENVTGLRYPIEKQPLRRVFYKFEEYLKGDMRYMAWYLEKWSKQNLLYYNIKNNIEEITWNSILDENNEPSRQNLLILPYNNGLVDTILNNHNLNDNNVLDWKDINNTNIEDIINFIKDFGNLHIKNEDSYTFTSSSIESFYFISLKSLQSNTSRLIHSEKNGLSDSIELLSWTNKYPFFIVKV